MNWKVIIIDDEQLARQRLIRLIKPHNEIELIAEAANGLEGLNLIEKLKPNLIFLDIEMPALNGFEMLSKLSQQPKVVFTTAYNQYAIKAFEENSIDYLLKPIEVERLEITLNKLKQHSAEIKQISFESLFMQFQPKIAIKTLTVKIGDKILLIKLNDITFIEADDRYVFIHTMEGKKHLTEYTLSALEEKLPDEFMRISRSTILNINLIKEIRKGFNGSKYFIINNSQESRLSSSRSYLSSIKERFEF